MQRYVIVWAHNTWLLADDTLYHSAHAAFTAIDKWLDNDKSHYTLRVMGEEKQ